MSGKSLDDILAPFEPTPKEAYNTILEDLGELKPGEIYLELGAGTFDLGFIAVKKYHTAKAFGIEMDEKLVNEVKGRIKKEVLENRIKIFLGNALKPTPEMKKIMRKADLVYIFLTPGGNLMVEPVLKEYLKDVARVVSYNDWIDGWYYSRVKDVYAPSFFRHSFILYRMKEVREEMRRQKSIKIR